MLHYSCLPWKMITSLWINKTLLVSLTKREIIGRYRGSFIGLLWSFFNPLFMLAVYAFVFGDVLNSRWSGGDGSKSEFALVLFAGLIVFNLFSECINKAPSLILNNVNYVKKVVFPLDILPWVMIGAGLFHVAISLIVWLIGYSFLIGMPSHTALLFPVVLLPFIILTLGLTWLLASLGVFLRDINQMVGIITTALMFLSPLFFPLELIPSAYIKYVQFNPITVPIEQVRNVLVWGKNPDWFLLSIYSIVAIFIAYIGFFFFQKSRKGFADVL